MWFDFLWYSLYCGGLGASLQYLWSMSINCKVTTMVSLLTIRHHTKLIQYCWLYSPGCTLHLYDLFILELKVCALGSWSPSTFCSPKPLSLWQPPIFSLYLWVLVFSFFFFFFRILHISEIMWYLSFFGFHCLVQYIQGASMLSQMADFIFYGWVVFHCVCTYTHAYIPLCVCVYSVYIYLHTHTPPRKETPYPLHTQLSIFSTFWGTARLLSRLFIPFYISNSSV